MRSLPRDRSTSSLVRWCPTERRPCPPRFAENVYGDAAELIPVSSSTLCSRVASRWRSLICALRYGFWHKAVDGDFQIAPPLAEQFDRTTIRTFAGADVSWVINALLEGACSGSRTPAWPRWSSGHPGASRSC